MPWLNNLNGLIYAALLQLYWSCRWHGQVKESGMGWGNNFWNSWTWAVRSLPPSSLGSVVVVGVLYINSRRWMPKVETFRYFRAMTGTMRNKYTILIKLNIRGVCGSGTWSGRTSGWNSDTLRVHFTIIVIKFSGIKQHMLNNSMTEKDTNNILWTKNVSEKYNYPKIMSKKFFTNKANVISFSRRRRIQFNFYKPVLQTSMGNSTAQHISTYY